MSNNYKLKYPGVMPKHAARLHNLSSNPQAQMVAMNALLCKKNKELRALKRIVNELREQLSKCAAEQQQAV